jgi:hypothetical protein
MINEIQLRVQDDGDADNPTYTFHIEGRLDDPKEMAEVIRYVSSSLAKYLDDSRTPHVVYLYQDRGVVVENRLGVIQAELSGVLTGKLLLTVISRCDESMEYRTTSPQNPFDTEPVSRLRWISIATKMLEAGKEGKPNDGGD